MTTTAITALVTTILGEMATISGNPTTATLPSGSASLFK